MIQQRESVWMFPKRLLLSLENIYRLICKGNLVKSDKDNRGRGAIRKRKMTFDAVVDPW